MALKDVFVDNESFDFGHLRSAVMMGSHVSEEDRGALSSWGLSEAGRDFLYFWRKCQRGPGRDAVTPAFANCAWQV